MNSSLVKDVLSWEKFYEGSINRETYPPKKVELFNRLVAHTNNFFLIAAIGAFSPGYLMLISKKLVSSLSSIDNDQIDELKWLIEISSKAQKKIYNREVVKIEHGMCSCVGGLDRAHLHLMTIDKNASNKLILDCINKVLVKRKTGIKSVEINGYKLESIHDIIEIMNSSNSDSYKINGKQLYYEDISNNLDVNNWIVSTRSHVSKGGHYVYFKTNSSSTSFLTDKNFQTQLGRQIVFEIEVQINPEIRNMSKKILENNNYANIWRWQEFAFNESILKTMNDLIPAFIEIKNNNKKNKYNFDTFEKK